MKKKSVIYELQSFSDFKSSSITKEFKEIYDFIQEEVLSEESSSEIRIDMGNYFCTPKGKVGLTYKPQIHIMLEGVDTHDLEDSIESKLIELKDYTLTDKTTFTSKIFTKHNLKLFRGLSLQSAFISVKSKKAETKVTTTASHHEKPPDKYSKLKKIKI